MQDAFSSNPLKNVPREDAVTSLPHTSATHARASSVLPLKDKPRGLWQKLMRFFGRLFGAGRRQTLRPASVIQVSSDRAAIALAAQMQPPMAFKGDTASTLVTPVSSYAGKPVEQAIRKRAEQQFRSMDITTATMN